MVTRKTLSKNSPKVLQLRIELSYIRPAIWRRFLVPETIKLAALHIVIQSVMGWMDCHMHEFDIGGIHYGPPIDPEFDIGGEPMMPETRTTLGKALGVLKSFRYTYDFGDGWEHKIKVEKVLPGEGFPGPRCVAGANACPPEDIGGPPGYEAFLEAIGNPDHPEHDEMLEWIGGGFDPGEFDPEEINALLAHIKT